MTSRQSETKETERQREKDRQTDRQADRQTDRVRKRDNVRYVFKSVHKHGPAVVFSSILS